MRTDKSYMIVISHFKLYPALFPLKWLICIPNISPVRGNVVFETLHDFYRTAIKKYFSNWAFSTFQLVSLCSFSLSKNLIIIDIYIVFYDLICSQPHISTCCVTNPKTWQTLQVFHSLSLANWWR